MSLSRPVLGDGKPSLVSLVDVLAALTAWKLIAGSLVLIALIGAADVITGPELSFSLFYLVPVFLSAAARRALVGAVALVATAVWSTVDVATRMPPYQQMVAPLWNTVVRFLILAVVAALVASLQDRLGVERRLARADPLTHLANSREFYRVAETELHRMERSGQPLSVAYVDVDDFKGVNDTHGHAVGDQVLVIAGKTMTANVRSVDVVARLGGDEFAVLLPEVSLDEATIILRRVHSALRAETSTWACSFSIGAATFTTPPHDVDEMLNAADHIMYDVKRNSKNNLRCELISFPAETASGTRVTQPDDKVSLKRRLHTGPPAQLRSGPSGG